MASEPVLQSIITCPQCGHRAEETMPTNACLFFYDCPACGAKLKPKAGDCCVFCSYGSVPCPPIQAGHDVVPEIRLQSRTKVTTGSLDSQALVQQPRKALPMGRALRILLGLVVIVYTVPVYFQVPMRLAVGAWLLVLGLIGIYSLIHIVVSRRIVAFGPFLGGLSRMGCSSRCMLQALRGYRSLATERVSSQRLPSSVSRW